MNATGWTGRGAGPGSGLATMYTEPGAWSQQSALNSLHAQLANFSVHLNPSQHDYDYQNGGGVGTWVNGTTASSALSYYEQLLAHPSIRMTYQLLRYVTPVLVVFGNFSNLLAFIILRRQSLRQHSVCYYMAACALSNLLVLNLVLGIAWLAQVFEFPYIGNITDWTCRLWTFISNVIIYCGIWFVVVLSIDRFIYLCYAHKASTYCTVFAAKAITLMVLIGLVVVSIHAMWTFELQPQGCFVSFSQDDLHSRIWPLWSATIYSYLPLTMLLFINIVLSVSLCLKRHRQQRAQQPGNADDFAITTLVISSAFFLLTVPATVINVIDIYFPMTWLSPDLVAEIEMTKKITEILSLANQTLLGVILLAFSRAFRQEVYGFMQALRFKRRPKVYEMGNVSSGEIGGQSAVGAGNSGSSTTNGAGTHPGRETEARTTSRSHIEYEVCNSCDVTTV